MGEARKFWIAFGQVPGIGPARLTGLLDYFGSLERAWSATKPELMASGLPRREIHALETVRGQIDPEQELERLGEHGYTAVTWRDAKYPDRLREIHSPPPVLYQWGRLLPRDHWAVAIVGTRTLTHYGRAVAEQLSGDLASSGVTIVSGLARGIDGVAHRAAVESGGRSVAVLGSGLDRIYPPDHRELARSISNQGAVLSEYPLGTAPEARNFPPRNRIISALSRAVVIVEAGRRSGALITADFAAEQGREVFAVPGDIGSPASAGCNELIRDGARPLLSPNDVFETLDLEASLSRRATQQLLPANETERRLMENLSLKPMHIDELQERLDFPVSEISASLALLELKGSVRHVGGMHYVLAHPMDLAQR
jgi:DNA processing protein